MPFMLLGEEITTMSYNGITLAKTAFTGIATAISGNLTILIPVGITIFGIMIGISLIPRIVYKFL